MKIETGFKEHKDFWTENFTEGVYEVAITIGLVPYLNTTGSYVRAEDGERVTQGRFYYELSKLMTNERKWDAFFEGEELNFSYSDDDVRYRVAITGGTKPSANIRKILDGRFALVSDFPAGDTIA